MPSPFQEAELAVLLRTGAVLASFHGHTAAVHTVAYAPEEGSVGMVGFRWF